MDRTPSWVYSKLVIGCLSSLLVAGGISLAAVQAAGIEGATTAQVAEPIFGLVYDAQQVHFGTVKTKELLPACKRALSDLSPQPSALTLYAEHKTPHSRIYIAGTEDNQKILVVHDDGVCSAGVPIVSILQRHHTPREVIDGPALSDEEDRGLIRDALMRYSAAFGGKGRFLEWLDSGTEKATSGCKGQPESSCPPTYQMFQPGLQEVIQQFRQN
jgi:hypothetical protein